MGGSSLCICPVGFLYWSSCRRREEAGLAVPPAPLTAWPLGFWGQKSWLWCLLPHPSTRGIREDGWGIRLTDNTDNQGSPGLVSVFNHDKYQQELLQRIKGKKQSIPHDIRTEQLFSPAYSWNSTSQNLPTPCPQPPVHLTCHPPAQLSPFPVSSPGLQPLPEGESPSSRRWQLHLAGTWVER